MPSYCWSEAYALGISTIDEQHKQLFLLINELHEAAKTGQGKLTLGKMLDHLIEYAVTHFSTEETMLRQHGYTGLAQHKAIHEHFKAKVTDMRREFELGRLALSVAVMAFLQKWLIDHIAGTDRKYADLVRRKAVRGL